MAILAIIVPFLLIIICNLPWKNYSERIILALGGMFCLVQIVCAILLPDSFFTAAPAWKILPDIHAQGIDLLSRIMLLTAALITLVTMITIMHYTKETKQQFHHINLVLLALAGMNGIVITRNIFTLYVFIEVVSVASYILIAADRGHTALESAFKYLLLSMLASVMLLAASALFILETRYTDLAEIARILGDPAMHSRLTLFACLLFTAGLLVKSGIIPFHWWLPDAYTTAPPGVSVFLAGIITKTGGVYSLFRLFNDVPVYPQSIRWMVLGAGLLSVVAGALLAMNQKDLKRMLAYSSISQMGYILLAAASGTRAAFTGGCLHLFNHAVFKSQLFINAAAVEEATGTRDMEQLGGLSKRLPVTAFTSLIGMLSAAGIPPLAGFWSKLFIVIGLWQAGYPVLAGAAILASLLTLAYLLRMQKQVFFGILPARWQQVKEQGAAVPGTALFLAAVSAAAGLLLPLVLNIFTV